MTDLASIAPEGIRLFCLPYAGGSATAYRPWARCAVDGLIVHALEYPGHGRRMGETPPGAIPELAAAVRQQMEPYLGSPYAIYGHSMGGLVGYEVVRQLQVHGAVLPRHLFISAIGFGRAPDSLTSLRCASDHQVLGELRALGATPAELLSCQDFADLVVRVIRADAEALASYEHPTVPAIQVSTSLYGAIDDDLVPLRRLRSWGAVIIPEPQLALFPGGHFFAFEDPTPVVADIARRLGVFGAGGECPATVRPGLRQEGAIR